MHLNQSFTNDAMHSSGTSNDVHSVMMLLSIMTVIPMTFFQNMYFSLQQTNFLLKQVTNWFINLIKI